MPKLKISPGQALLLLMKKHKDDPVQLEQLKQWYLSGFEPRYDANGTPLVNLPVAFQHMLADPALANYEVSFEKHVINDEPSRRYFETHLAYNTLKENLDGIDSRHLNMHRLELQRIIPSIIQAGKLDTARWANDALDGKVTKDQPNFFKEYATYIHSIDDANGPFKAFTPEQREKVKSIASASMLGVLNAQYGNLPINIYGTGLYADDAKGKVMHGDAESVRSSHLGVMKSHMPLPRDDLAATEQTLDFLKPSDQSSYIDNALWVQYNFAKAVHPFSNSISGTMLCQIRNIEREQRQNQGADFGSNIEKLKQYSQLFISTMLFGSGGHTLHEYTSPLGLPAVTSELTGDMRGRILDLNAVFRDNNPGFEVALEETMQYNDQLLVRQGMHQDLKETLASPEEKDHAAMLLLREQNKPLRDAIMRNPNAIAAAGKAFTENLASGKTHVESTHASHEAGQQVLKKEAQPHAQSDTIAARASQASLKERFQTMKKNIAPKHAKKENKENDQDNKDDTTYSPLHKL